MRFLNFFFFFNVFIKIKSKNNMRIDNTKTVLRGVEVKSVKETLMELIC